MSEPPGLPQWSDYTGFVRRHRLWFAGLIALGLLAGTAWSFAQPRVYSSTASFSLAPVPVYVMRTTSELVPPEVTIDTDAQLLQSPRVQTALATALGVAPADVERHTAVTATAGSRVLHLKVSSTSRAAAAEAANAAVEAFVLERRRALGALRRSETRQLRLLLAGQEDELARAQQTELLVTTDNPVFDTIVALRESLTELDDAHREPAQLIAPATPAVRPDHANSEVPILSGTMLGLVAACLVGAARDHSRRAAPAPPAPSTVLSTVLGTVPSPALTTALRPVPRVDLRNKEHDYV